ncbi:MAG: Maf family protein, partial [Bacteroidales bacterium]
MQSIKNYPYKIILGSKSPRRQELLNSLGFSFEVDLPNTDESYPSKLLAQDVPLYIARKKALSFDFSKLANKV